MSRGAGHEQADRGCLGVAGASELSRWEDRRAVKASARSPAVATMTPHGAAPVVRLTTD